MNRRLRASWFPGVGWEGLGKAKKKHAIVVLCFMVRESGVGRAWEGKKMKRGVAASHRRRVLKNET